VEAKPWKQNTTRRKKLLVHIEVVYEGYSSTFFEVQTYGIVFDVYVIRSDRLMSIQ